MLIVAGLQPLYTSLAGQPFIYGGNDPTSFVLHLFLADQWAGTRALSFNGPIWSVSSEVFVYVSFFMLVRAFGRSRRVIGTAIAAGLWSM